MRGLEFSGIRGYRFPSPQPSPHGRGGGCGEVCDWGWMKVLLPIPPNRAGESEDKCGPHPSPLPWGEVGPQVRVRGSGLTGVRRDRIPSPHPPPHGRGGGYGEVCEWGWMKVLLPIPPNRAGENEDKRGPHPSPLPWGEVGAKLRVRGSDLSWIRRYLVPRADQRQDGGGASPPPLPSQEHTGHCAP